ncbi:MAG: peptide deformylase [Defluviitaleaceae bacterium]|nr:peptide deformylase [Defluviitaleaceae bacterium]
MALRNMRTEEDSILRKISKPIKVIDAKIIQLLDDMEETMRHHNGVGLAAVQVGKLKRAFIVDVSEDGGELIEFINPVLVSCEGSKQGNEGCLSVPRFNGLVERPEKTIIRALNRHGEEFDFIAEGFLSVAINHELDHLDGIIFTDKAIELYDKTLMDDDEQEEDDDE